MPSRPAEPADDTLSRDVLVGAEAIAVFMFGHKSHRKKVFNFAEKKALPVFRLGRSLYARKSTLLGWIADQERLPKAAAPTSHQQAFEPTRKARRR